MLRSLMASMGALALITLAWADEPKVVVVKFGKLSAEAPATWKSEKPNNRLRSHQFKLASKSPDYLPAEIAVNPESNPDPDKSFPRWKAMFDPPEGKTLDDVSRVMKKQVGTATVHLLDVTGTWKYKERPFDPKSKLEILPEYRVIWAIVVTGDEATHVRFSGHQSVVDHHLPSFENWLQSMK